jgi:hypothetical protein
MLAELESRYTELMKLTEKIGISQKSSRTQVSAFIWQLRQMEIFSYELIYRFGRYNNVRDIYRNILLYWSGRKDIQSVKSDLEKSRIDNQVIKGWLTGIVKRIKRNQNFLSHVFGFEEYKGVLFKSYGQAPDTTIIFTMDPVTGRFLATDRKLAEHMDFVPYLLRKRDQLLRGEFFGDLRKADNPIVLGVWSVANEEDLHERLKLLRTGARQLLEMDLKKDKQLTFYATTFNMCDCEIDTSRTVTLGELAEMKDEELDGLMVSSENELGGLVFAE